jgi:putative DNA methylase
MMTDHPGHRRKKLIEVALPLEAINAASAREKSIRHGHPSTLHLWWARRPLAAARAVIFAQMVDDPSSLPDLFPTEKKQQKERERLFRIIEDLVQWENTTNETVLEAARAEIWQSWRRACAENADHPRAKDLFNRTVLPGFHDPFAGGGALPLEAQRLGLESHASDLNPVAVLINKAMIEIPPKFAGRAPVNPAARKEKALIAREWKGAQGLAEDVRHYGQWMRDEAEKRIGALYPKMAVTAEMAKDRPDLKPYVGQQLTVIAWLWARTVKSPNPAFAKVDVPLASTFMLSTKAGKEAYVEPVIEGDGYRFTVKVGKPRDAEKAKGGTKLSRGANFACLMSGTPMAGDYIKGEGKAGRMGARLMAIVAEGARGRVYLAPTPEHEAAARKAKPEWKPEVTISGSTQYLGVKPYGMDRFDQLFTDRQLVALTTFSDLVGEAMQQVRRDALQADLPDDPKPLRDGGTGATAYAEAVGVYLGFVCSRLADFNSTVCGWIPVVQATRNTFARQAIPMTWDYAEINFFGDWLANYNAALEKVIHPITDNFQPLRERDGHAFQADAHTQSVTADKLVSTDPPYYDNVPYADLSDFFYVWLRRSLRGVFPDLFATLAVPKAEELVAFAYRHEGGKSGAEAFFLDGMTRAMHRLVEQAHPAFPVTIYYAFKQAESDNDAGTSSTGWETFLDAVIRAGFGISGTWPMRTEKQGRVIANDANALASSIVLVCRQRAATAPTATRREFVAALKSELPVALRHLQEGNIAPVDLAQAAIGPGMAVYTRYSKVLNPDDTSLNVRRALVEINAALDEHLAQEEGDLDADSRFALTFFESHGFSERPYGDAEGLAVARNISVQGVAEAGILRSVAGRVQLLRREQLSDDWDPSRDDRLCVWEATQHLIKRLETDGEAGAAALLLQLKNLSGHSDLAANCRALAYRLYNHCEKTKQAEEARSYNGLVIAWPELERQASAASSAAGAPQQLTFT